jgi:hypothetical protein
LTPPRIAILLIGCALIAGTAAVSVLADLNPGPIDTEAVHRIHKLCGNLDDCTVRLHDIIPGDWDTFQEFGPHQEQADINDALHVSNVPTSELQRILVFKKAGKIQKVVYEDYGVQRSLHNEVDFEEEYRSRTPTYVTYTPDKLLHVTACQTDIATPFWLFRSGTYYVLSPLPLDPYRQASC